LSSSGIAAQFIDRGKSAPWSLTPRVAVHEFRAYAPELNPAEYCGLNPDRALMNGAHDKLVETSPQHDQRALRISEILTA
jgi:hypothetical protein